MATIDRTAIDVTMLRERMEGRVVAPGDADWDSARLAFNLTVDQRPAAVAFPMSERDVAAVVAFARDSGLRVAPQRTGHNAAPLGDLGDSILLKTDYLMSVDIDTEARVARVGAGVKWQDVVPQASELGLAALHGSASDVSVVGYTLGGGMGWYGRKHGLAGNSVTAIEIVTADGALRRVDENNDPELFWALRGGGGNFGVVTAIEFQLFPVEELYAGLMFFPFERASEVLHAWHELLPSLPEEMTSVGRIMQFPPIPQVPEEVRGKSFAIVEAFYLGSQEEGERLLRPVRELGPVMDSFGMVPPAAISEMHMDPPDPVPGMTGSQLLGELPAEGIDEFVRLLGPGSGSPILTAELRHLGGAFGRGGAHHGALDRLEGEFAMFAAGMATGPESAAAIEAHLARVTEALRPYDSGRSYANFVERAADPRSFYSPEAYARLQAVKAQYDPESVFRANHPITPNA